VTVTCLGCGCACDDLQVQVRDGGIESIAPPCPLAQRWFGSGRVPDQVLVAGRAARVDEAIATAVDLLAASAGRVLVLLAPDLTAEAQRLAVGVADALHAVVDSATSSTAAQGILVAQRRGRAAATLGEIRNRADVLLFWGVDPSERYPRYLERYALEPVGTHVPDGRRGRTVISVNIGNDRAPAGADLEVTIAPDEEIAALSVLRATVLGNPVADLPEGLRAAAAIAGRLLQARYAAVIHDGEPGRGTGDPARPEGLIALAQALNASTRAAISTLRAGGNRSGAESVLTWQTGFPMAVDFANGFPRYEPGRRGIDRLADGALDAVLIAGSAAALNERARAALGGLPVVAIGPRASELRPEPRVVVDTGVAGIHESGTGYRMDDVPLPLTPPLSGARGAAPTLNALLHALSARRRSG
jgi:formylmethanofuran dehydrogenase subunit B